MKKKLMLTLLTLCTLSVKLSAQNVSVFIGGMGGGNLSLYSYTGDYANTWTSSSAKPGLNGGVVFGAEFGKMAVVSGINFIQKGTKSETDNYRLDNNYVGYLKARENTSFINIPLLFRYQFLGDKFGLVASAGPSFNIGLSGNSRLELEVANVGSESQSGTIRFGKGINNTYRRFQPGFMLGPGMLMRVGEKGKLGVNIMWDLGFNATNERNARARGIDGNVMNISTILGVSYTHHFTFSDKY
jgi:hypothetical protein